MKNKLGRLYFRYILHSKLEAYGYNAKKLAMELEELGYIKVDGETYDEIQKMPTKRETIELIIQKNSYDDPKKGVVIKLENNKGEILGTDKIIYFFDSDQVKGTLEVNDKVTFKQAYKTNSLAVARDITKD